MNCESLSLTGEKSIIASSIHLLRQAINDETGTLETFLEDIDSIFIQTKNLLATFDENSSHPVSASAIATWLGLVLLDFRRNDVLIQMSEVDNLLTFLNNYRLLTNQNFTTIETESLQYSEGGTNHDLATRIAGLDGRLSADENELHVLAAGLAGSDIMSSEQSLTSWLSTHARDLLIDSAFKASKFHEVFVSANEHACIWGLPNYFLTNTQENNHSTSYSPSWYWALPSGKDVTMRYKFARRLWDPTGLPYVPLVMPWPSGDHYKMDMNHIYECDQEHRGEASILLGKKGTSVEGQFRIKAITDYHPSTYATFGADDPVHVLATNTLFTVSADAANFHVPLFVNGQSVNAAGGNVTKNVNHIHHNETIQNIQVKRFHTHTHNNISGGDFITTYVAPAKTVINRTSLSNLNTYQEFTNLQTINKNYKSYHTVPILAHNEYVQNVLRNDWASIRNKPEFAALLHVHPEYAATNHVHGEYALESHHHDDTYANSEHHHDATYASISHNHDGTYAAVDHHHNGVYASEVYIDDMIGTRASQVWVEGALAGKSNTNHNHDDRYNTKAEVSTLIQDRVTVLGLSLTLQDYATNDSLAAALSNNVSTDTPGYLYKVDVFNNALRMGFKGDASEQTQTVPNFDAFNGLLARVSALEASVAILENRANATEQTTASLNTVQDSIWAFTQLAFNRLDAGGL